MTDREIMDQALNALEEINKLSIGENAICLPAEIDTAMDALRERLAQPEQEPVFDCPRCGHCCPQRKPLTEEEIAAGRRAPWGRGLSLDAFKAGVRFAETTHGIKEKNT